MTSALDRRRDAVNPHVAAPRDLFACLRDRRSSSMPALLAIARDFSPRVARVSDIEVILDVSGLGQLIGEPSAIGAELVRAVTDVGVDASIALAPTATAARVLAA